MYFWRNMLYFRTEPQVAVLNAVLYKKLHRSLPLAGFVPVVRRCSRRRPIAAMASARNIGDWAEDTYEAVPPPSTDSMPPPAAAAAGAEQDDSFSEPAPGAASVAAPAEGSDMQDVSGSLYCHGFESSRRSRGGSARVHISFLFSEISSLLSPPPCFVTSYVGFGRGT